MESYDNDFCCMELYDKHFRCMEVNPGVPGFQRQVFKYVKFLSERSKEIKEQKKNRIRLQCTKCTVWPRNDDRSSFCQLSQILFTLLCSVNSSQVGFLFCSNHCECPTFRPNHCERPTFRSTHISPL